MGWRGILKESSPKLRQANIVTTIQGGEPEPEKEDERCKKKLQEIIDGIFRLFDNKEYFMTYTGYEFYSEVLRNPPKLGDAITEEAACSLLEEMQTAKNNNGFIWEGDSGIVGLCYMTGTKGADGEVWSDEHSLVATIRRILEDEHENVEHYSNWFFRMMSRPYGRTDERFDFCIRLKNFTKMLYAGEEDDPDQLYIKSIAKEWKEIHDGILGLL